MGFKSLLMPKLSKMKNHLSEIDVLASCTLEVWLEIDVQCRILIEIRVQLESIDIYRIPQNMIKKF